MGFYDAKGYWRDDGDGFYDARGEWVSPGGAFYDAKGYLRSPGDGFYDTKGNWVSPGGAFYDGRGYLQSGISVAESQSDGGNAFAIGILFLLSIPFVMLWSLVTFLIEWTTAHLLPVCIGYAGIAALVSLTILKQKRHHGLWALFSFIGSYLCLLSFAYIALVYAIPYVLQNGAGFESSFEFTCALVIGAAAVSVLQFFNYFHERAVLELILSIAFFAIVIHLLKRSTGDIKTLEDLAALYGISPTAWFRLLFGFLFWVKKN